MALGRVFVGLRGGLSSSECSDIFDGVSLDLCSVLCRPETLSIVSLLKASSRSKSCQCSYQGFFVLAAESNMYQAVALLIAIS